MGISFFSTEVLVSIQILKQIIVFHIQEYGIAKREQKKIAKQIHSKLMKSLFVIFAGIEMTLLPLATLIALLLHFFPCHHVRMEDREIAHNNIISLTDSDDGKFIHQDAVPHQIKKRNGG